MLHSNVSSELLLCEHRVYVGDYRDKEDFYAEYTSMRSLIGITTTINRHSIGSCRLVRYE